MDTSRRGIWVIVRCFGDEARRVRVWEEDEGVVWVHDDENYRKHARAVQSLCPVGFRRGSVFEDDPELFEAASLSVLWERLQSFVWEGSQ